ncbi:MAG: ZIP family metal transporter [Eubacterium sp.]
MIQIYFGILIAAAMMLAGGWVFIALNKKYPKSIGLLLGLSGGFLLGIIFFGIIPEAAEMLEVVFEDKSIWMLSASLAGGALFLILFEKMIPVQHHHDLSEHEVEHHDHNRLIYIILAAFGFHSLFELVSILVAGNADPVLAWFLIVVIGMHNIPIGFVIIAQLEALDCSMKKSLLLIGGLAVLETGVAVICYLLLMPFITDAFQGILLGMTAGIMIYLVFDELLPTIYKDEEQHHVNYAIIIGVLAMLLSLNFMGH